VVGRRERVLVDDGAVEARRPDGVAHDGPARHFAGWLGLLRLLADAMAPQPSAGVSGRAGGER
jgi:hypothetical protein